MTRGYALFLNFLIGASAFQISVSGHGMAAVVFKDIPQSHVERFSVAFELIAAGKQLGKIDEDALKSVLSSIYKEKFISTKEESDFWLAEWRKNPAIDTPWDFGSWVEAFMNAEIDLQKIIFSADGSGSVSFEQLACPSGGSDALENLVKVFGGVVVSNSAL